MKNNLCLHYREVLRSIAEQNGIHIELRECDYVEDCIGPCLCNKWDSEILMNKLRKLESSGVQIKIDLESLITLNRMSQNSMNPFYDMEEECRKMDEVKLEDIVPGQISEEEANDFCKDCVRCGSIIRQNGVASRCSCLTELFFAYAVKNRRCALKKTILYG